MSKSRTGLKIIAVCHLFPASLLSFLLIESLSRSLLEPLILVLPLSVTHTHTHTRTHRHTQAHRNNPGAIWMLVVLQGETGRGRLLMCALTKPRSRPWIANSSLHWPQTLAATDKTWRIACIIGKTASLHYVPPPQQPTSLPHWYQHIPTTDMYM